MGTVRIIGGEYGGRTLRFPDATHLRPTGNRARETLFNWLQFRLSAKRCLDCYAGSGALGLEALSRGATYCDFVESNKTVGQHLKQSISQFNAPGSVHISPLEQFARRAEQPYDIVFIDPPHALDLWQITLDLLLENNLVHRQSTIYVEHNGGFDLKPNNRYSVLKDKRIGQNTLLLLQAI